MSLGGELAKGGLLGSESTLQGETHCQVPLFVLRLVLEHTPLETTDSGVTKW